MEVTDYHTPADGFEGHEETNLIDCSGKEKVR